MGIDAKEKTALGASVGADAGQSIQNDSDNSIPASGTKRNGKMENPAENPKSERTAAAGAAWRAPKRAAAWLCGGPSGRIQLFRDSAQAAY